MADQLEEPMSEHADSLRDDLSYMRKMAEQGRSGPILGGAFLAGAGLTYGAAALLQWLIETGATTLPITPSQIWIGASVLFALVWLALFVRLRGSGVAQAPGATQFAFGMAWSGCGLGILAMLGALAIAGNRMNVPQLMEANAFVAFAFYGTAWFVSGALARQAWMFAVALAAFAITLLLAALIGTPNELLAFAAGLVLTLAVPGFVLASRAGR
jgi:hypothetical protein